MSWNKDSIKKLRQDLRLTQMEFAKRLGCRQQTVSEWEQGLYEPANAYTKLLQIFARESVAEISRDLIYQTNSSSKKVSSFTLPRIEVPEVFREELGLPDYESPQEKTFDPAID